MRILVAEDTASLAAQVFGALTGAGYAVDVAPTGEDALHLGGTERYDAIVLDLGLPRIDGLSILRHWRKANMIAPVLILTARDTWSDKVDGLNAGADDYLAKPFAMAELLARVNALIRRAHGHARPRVQCGDLSIDLVARSVMLRTDPVRLTAMEYEVLAVLALNLGKPLSKARLTEHIYDQHFDRDSNTLEVIISRLRRKVGDGLIETERGRGYRLVVPDPAG